MGIIKNSNVASLEPINTINDDLESFSSYLNAYLNFADLWDTSMGIYSIFIFQLLHDRNFLRAQRDFEVEFQSFLKEQRTLMNAQYDWRTGPNFQNELVNYQIDDEQTLIEVTSRKIYHSCFRLTSSINANIVKEEWLENIDWKINNHRNIKLKNKRKRVHEDQLTKLEKRIKNKVVISNMLMKNIIKK